MEVFRSCAGRAEVALARGIIESVELIPENPPTHPEALAAIDRAEWVTLGPGSWYSERLAPCSLTGNSQRSGTE